MDFFFVFTALNEPQRFVTAVSVGIEAITTDKRNHVYGLHYIKEAICIERILI